MKKEIEKYLNESNQYVYDLENKPENRMLEVHNGDEVFFLKPDEDETALNDKGDSLYNCGLAKVVSIENLDGQHRAVMSSTKVGKIHLVSDSYPFELSVEVKHVLKNYTAEERENADRK